MTPTRIRSGRPRRAPMPWLYAEHIAGLVLGLALAAMAVDYGMNHAPSPSPLPVAPAATTGP